MEFHHLRNNVNCKTGADSSNEIGSVKNKLITEPILMVTWILFFISQKVDYCGFYFKHKTSFIHLTLGIKKNSCEFARATLPFLKVNKSICPSNPQFLIFP